MACRSLTVGMVLCGWSLMQGGCASLEELRQVQMAQRNLEAEKARLEQELYDAREVGESMRSRVTSLEELLENRDMLIENLDSENNRLQQHVERAEELIKKIAERPMEPVPVITSRLPAELDSVLQQFSAQYPDSVMYDPANGQLKWKSDLLFAFASDVVKDSAAGSLRQFSEIMRSPAAKDFDVVVAGHTDNVRISRPQTLKNHPTNRHLSVHRAISVAKKLEESGLVASRIGVMGFGSHRPIVPNTTDENRARNRRVEIYVVPHGAFSAGSTVSDTVESFTGNEKKPNDTIK